jgi:hypothetical protein
VSSLRNTNASAQARKHSNPQSFVLSSKTEHDSISIQNKSESEAEAQAERGSRA